MLRLTISLALLASATSAAAEDWRLVEITDAAPGRTAGLIDYDSVDRSDAQFPRITAALLLETPRDGMVRILTTSVVDCAGMRFKLVDVEMHDVDGKIQSEAVDQPYQEMRVGSPADTMRFAACNNDWYLTKETGKKPLGEIAADVFGS